MEFSLFNMIISSLLAFVLWWAKAQHDEMKRLNILLNKTREELPKEYVHIARQKADLDRIMDRLDRFEEKLDRLIQNG